VVSKETGASLPASKPLPQGTANVAHGSTAT
jgi:hypothetical protein